MNSCGPINQDAGFSQRMRAQMAMPIGAKAFFGDFRLLNTIRAILNSLGTFPQGLNVQRRVDLSFAEAGDYAGQIPFTLTEEGLAFFRNVLEIENPKKEAHLFVCRIAGGYDPIEEKIENMQGIKALPFRILVKDTDSPRLFSYDLSLFLLGESKFDILESKLRTAFCDSLDAIYPAMLSLVRIKVKSGEVYPRSYPLQEKLTKQVGFNGSLEMLYLQRLRKKYVLATLPPGWDRYEDLGFSHLAKDSRAFQDFYCEHAGLARGKRVVEIGAGTGVNLLYSLKFGAQSVAATEPEIAYALQALWNLQYAADTLQIAAGLVPTVDLILDSGIPPEPAHLYLFNAPCIQSAAEPLEERTDLDRLNLRACFITEEIFIDIFHGMEQKILTENAVALLRVMPGFPNDDSTYFPLPQNQLHELKKMAWADYRIAVERAKRFLASFPHLEAVVNKDCGYFFTINRAAGSS